METLDFEDDISFAMPALRAFDRNATDCRPLVSCQWTVLNWA